MNELKNIILKLIKEIESKENNLNVRGGRGYSTGTANPDKTVKVSNNLGKEYVEDVEEYILKPVKISKAFKKG